MAQRKAPGWWYPWIFVAGMAVVVVANGILIFLASDSWTGLETEDHYRKGLAYNQNLAGARAQEALGWTVELAFAADPALGAHGGALRATFRDRANAPIPDLNVQARLVRPTHEGYDRDAVLDHRGDGVYGTELDLPLPGQWEVRLHAARAGADHQTSHRIVVP